MFLTRPLTAVRSGNTFIVQLASSLVAGVLCSQSEAMASALTMRALVNEIPASELTHTFSAIDRGSFRDTGFHVESNDNSYTGRLGGGPFTNHSFFLFDLTQLTTPVVAATVEIQLTDYISPDSTETVMMFDVDTPGTELTVSHATGSLSGTAIHNDLGTGRQYAHFVVSQDELGNIFTVPLNQDAVNEINNAHGKSFAFGMKLQEPFTLPQGDEGAVFGRDDETIVQRLVLTVVPEPLTIYSLTCGLAFLCGWRPCNSSSLSKLRR